MKNPICNKLGSASFETVVMSTMLFGLAYIIMQFTGVFLASNRALFDADSKVRNLLASAETPCLEGLANGEFAGGMFSKDSEKVTVGVGSVIKQVHSHQKILFVRNAICN